MRREWWAQGALNQARGLCLILPALFWWQVQSIEGGARDMTINDVLGYGQQALTVVGGVGGFVALLSPFFRGALLMLGKAACAEAEEAAAGRALSSAQKLAYAVTAFDVALPFYLRPFAGNEEQKRATVQQAFNLLFLPAQQAAGG